MADLLSALVIFGVGYGVGLLHAGGHKDHKERLEAIDRLMEPEFRPPLHPSDDRDEWRP